MRSAVSMALPHAATSVRSARRQIAADLLRRGVPRSIIEDAVLVVSEIVSNALKHARPRGSGRVEVTWDVRDGAVEIQVADGGGPTQPQVSAPSLSALGGRGLSIVAALAGAWGVRQDQAGTVVWARLPLARSAVPGRAPS
jgi:anti-sigma regulatory factor (Ser/Thr protein kinase)